MTLTFTIESTDADCERTQLSMEVGYLYNFGYAGRDSASVREHIDELATLGLPTPQTVPSVFRLAPRLGSQDSEVVVSGDDSYGEVEYALIKAADENWYVTVASDHSDLAIEKISTARSKTVYPDVLANAVWPLGEVREDWDQLVLTNCRTDESGTEVAQTSSTAELLRPDDLIEILESRIGGTIDAGSVILSGTIAGIPDSGASRWVVSISDPARDRTIAHEYSVEALPEELVGEGVDAS